MNKQTSYTGPLRFLIAAIAVLAMLATATVTTVGAQSNQTDEQELLASEARLQSQIGQVEETLAELAICLLYTSPSPRDS